MIKITGIKKRLIWLLIPISLSASIIDDARNKLFEIKSSVSEMFADQNISPEEKYNQKVEEISSIKWAKYEEKTERESLSEGFKEGEKMLINEYNSWIKFMNEQKVAYEKMYNTGKRDYNYATNEIKKTKEEISRLEDAINVGNLTIPNQIRAKRRLSVDMTYLKKMQRILKRGLSNTEKAIKETESIIKTTKWWEKQIENVKKNGADSAIVGIEKSIFLQVYNGGQKTIPGYPIDDRRAITTQLGGKANPIDAMQDGVGTITVFPAIDEINGKTIKNKMFFNINYFNEDPRIGEEKFNKSVYKVCDYKCPPNMVLIDNGICKSSHKCPEGYNKSVDGCEKEIVDTRMANFKVDSICPPSYLLKKGKCVKETFTATQPFIKKVYNCPQGYILAGNQCKYINTINGKTTEVLRCQRGYALNKNTKSCEYLAQKTISPMITTKNYCPDGFMEFGGVCQKETSIIPDITEKKECRKGLILTSVNGIEKCYTKVLSDLKNNMCPKGYKKNGNKCFMKYFEDPTFIKKYSCKDGFHLFSSMCVKKETKKVSKKIIQKCPNGYKLNESKTSCNTTEKLAIPASIIKKTICPEGFSRAGHKCKKIQSLLADYTVSSTCKEGYTLIKKTCQKSVFDIKDVVYNTVFSCDEGYKLKDGDCSKILKTNVSPICENSYFAPLTGDCRVSAKCINKKIIPKNKEDDE